MERSMHSRWSRGSNNYARSYCFNEPIDYHAFFRVAGTNNDINGLNQSLMFNDVLYGCTTII